jgi:dTDP-4-amino-4,6-dideoxygalactose transaminase
MICASPQQRGALIDHLKKDGIWAVSHYISLHSSPYYRHINEGPELVNSDLYTQQLVRLPLYYELSTADIGKVISSLKTFNY